MSTRCGGRVELARRDSPAAHRPSGRVQLCSDIAATLELPEFKSNGLLGGCFDSELWVGDVGQSKFAFFQMASWQCPVPVR